MAADMSLRVKLAAQTAELDAAIQGLLADFRKLSADAKASMAAAGAGSDDFISKLQRVGVNVTAVNRELMETGQRANQAVAGNAMATSNIAAQFNDIGVMMASGQNPLIMAIQQGTQLSQALGPAGAAGKLAALKAGFMAFLSPTTLATIALIAGAGALVQWGMSALGAGEEAKTLKDRVSELGSATREYEAAARAADVPISELVERYRDMADEVKRALEAKRELAAFDAVAAAKAVTASSGVTTMPDMSPAEVLSAAQARTEWAPYFAELARLRDEALAQGYGPVEAASVARATLADQNPELDLDAAMAQMDAYEGSLADIQRSLGVSREDAERLAVATARWMEAADSEDFRGIVETGDEFLTLMESLFGSVGNANRLTGGLAAAVLETVDAAKPLATGGKEVDAAFEGAAKKADKIGDALKRVADLSKSTDDLVMSRLNLQFNGDAVGLAAARAGAEFDRAQKGSEGADPIVLAGLERERQAYIARAVEIEKNRQAVEALNAAEKAGQDAGGALVELQREADLRAVILKHGADSLEAEEARVVAARAVFAEQVAGWQATKGISEEMAQSLMDAWDAANGVSEADMASGIAAATVEARLLASALGIGLDKAIGIENAIRRAQQPARLGFGLPPAQDGVIGGATVLGFGKPSTFTPASRDPNFRSDLPVQTFDVGGVSGGSGGGGGTRETIATIQKEAQEVLAALDRQLATIREKLRAGLLTEAEAQKAMAQGRENAANQLAEIIPRLDAMGAAGAKAAEAWRVSLEGLAGEVRSTGGELGSLVEESFKSPFAALIRGAGEAQGAVDRMADRILDRMAEIASDQLWTSVVEPLVGQVFGTVFTGAGSSGLTLEAAGDVFDGGRVVPFAQGGVPFAPLSAWRNAVVSRPTLFPMARGLGLMGEAGREAILPLTGDDMVRAIGPGGQELALDLTRAAGGALAVRLPDQPVETAFAQGGVPDGQEPDKAGQMSRARATVPPLDGRGDSAPDLTVPDLTGAGLVRALGPDGLSLAAQMVRSRGADLSLSVPGLPSVGSREPVLRLPSLPTLGLAKGPDGKPVPPPGWTFDPMKSDIMREIASYGAKDANGHWLKGGLPAAVREGGKGAAEAAGQVNLSPKTVVNVTTPPGASASVAEQDGGGDDGMSKIVDVIVDVVDQKLAAKYSNNQGSSIATLSRVFGLKRQGK